MPYRHPSGSVRLSAPPHFDPRSNFQTQVNVGPGGTNILGDAGNEPSIAVDPTAPNRMAIGWRQFDTITSDFRQAGRAFSRDGGRTWTNPGVLEPGVFRSDPVLRADAEGAIYYCSLTVDSQYHTKTFRSFDGGAAFDAGFPSFGGDKEWLCVDRTTLPSRGNLYQFSAYPSGFTRSFDMGRTWSTPTGGIMPSWGICTVGPDGAVFLAGEASGAITVLRSSNAGDPLVQPVFTGSIANLRGLSTMGGPNPGGLDGQVWVDVDRSSGPRRGWVYLLCSIYDEETHTIEVMFNRSTDGGATWLPDPIKVNNDPVSSNSFHWFGTIGVAPNGRIDVLWNDTRESQNPAISRLYYAYSSDGGTTWFGNAPVGPPWNSTIGWPAGQNKIGDYYDIESDNVGAFVAYAATYNGEQDVYLLRINDWDCNGNSIGDSIDLAVGILHDCDGNGIPDECEIAAGVPAPCACYPNCDQSTTPPILNVQDFVCFLNRFARGDPYANCDGSTSPPLTVLDFGCFLNRFAAGCL